MEHMKGVDMMRRLFKLIPVLLILLTIVPGAGPAEAAAKNKYPEKIRFGYQPGHTLILIPKIHGWLEEEFAKEGIKIEYQKFISGPPIIEAFAGGRLDFGTTGDQPAIQARANNIDLKAVSVYTSGYRNYGLVVPPGSDIKTPRDLKGKKVAITVGSVGHQLLYLYLKSVGLTVKDLQLVNLQPSDMKAALATRTIDAVVTWEPFISSFESDKVGVHVLDAKGIKNVVNVTLVTGSFAKEYPDVVRRILKIHARAEKWIRDNPKKTVELVTKETGFKADVLAEHIAKSNFDIRLTDAAIGSITDTAHFLRETNVIRKDVDIRDLIDTSYLKAIGVQ
jgi:sulfonate transport system substrate-binding protein